MDERSAIPADLRRRVLVEAGHRCAIPTCRHIEVEVHHIVPWAQSPVHEYENLIALCPNCHARADRGDIDRKALRLYKLNLRFVHDKYSQAEMDVLFELYHMAPGECVAWPPFMDILLRRIIEAGLVQVTPGGRPAIRGATLMPSQLRLTTKGRAFVDELGIHEL